MPSFALIAEIAVVDVVPGEIESEVMVIVSNCDMYVTCPRKYREPVSLNTSLTCCDLATSNTQESLAIVYLFYLKSSFGCGSTARFGTPRFFSRRQALIPVAE